MKQSEKSVTLNIDDKFLTNYEEQIFYYYANGYKNFTIIYNTKKTTLIEKDILIRLKKILGFSYKFNLIFHFKGFNKEKFERYFFTPDLIFEFEDKIFFENTVSGNDYSMKLNSIYQKNFDKLNLFQNQNIILVKNEILNDFKSENMLYRKKFSYVLSYPKDLEESSLERFVYYIYNSKSEFDKTFSLIQNFFEKNFLQDIKKFLENSHHIALSFAEMNNDVFRKTLYFSTLYYNSLLLKELSQKYDLTKYEGRYPQELGFDFTNNKIKDIKLYYTFKKISKVEILDFVSEFKFENKKIFQEFLKIQDKDIFNNISLDMKLKNNNVFKKRIGFSLALNTLNIDKILKLFNLKENFFKENTIETINFEFGVDSKEKINLYYKIKDE